MTELDDNCAAMVFNPNTDSLDVYLPHNPIEDDSGMFAFVCACAARYYADPEWAESMIDWFMTQHNGSGRNN